MQKERRIKRIWVNLCAFSALMANECDFKFALQFFILSVEEGSEWPNYAIAGGQVF